MQGVQDVLGGYLDGLAEWQALLVVVAATAFATGAVRVGGDAVVRRVTARVPGDLDDRVFRVVHPPLYVTVSLLGALVAVDVLDVGEAAATTVAGGALSALTVVWGWTLVRLGRVLADELTTTERVDETVVPILLNVWSTVVVGGAAFLVLAVWGIDVTPLLASAGIVGIVVGLAAKDTIANFFGSIALFFDGTYAVGDYVVLESGERGRVEDVTVRSTVIRTRDDVLVTVPNAVLNSSLIVNESTPNRERRIRLPLSVGYDSDLERVEAALLDVAAENDLVIDRPAPRVRYRGFGSSGVDVELLAWIADPVLRGRGTHLLVKDVHARFAADGVEIPYPRRDVALTVDGAAGAALDALDGDAPAASPDADPLRDADERADDAA